MTLGTWLALQEDGPHFAGLRHRGQGGFVEFFVGRVGMFQNLRRQSRRHEPEQFVGGEHAKNLMRDA